MTIPDDMKSKAPQILEAELARSIAAVKKKSHYTMLGIVALASASVIAVAVLFLTGQANMAGQILRTVAPTVAALLAYRKGSENAAAIHEVRIDINGRLSQLLTATEAAARAEGHAAAVAARVVRSTDISSTEGG